MVYRVTCKDCDIGTKIQHTRQDAVQIAEDHADEENHTLRVTAVDGDEELVVE